MELFIGLNALKPRGNTYRPEISRSIFSDPKVQRKYSKEMIYIGNQSRDGLKSKKDEFLDFRNALVMMVIGARGSGKTWDIRGISDRAKRANYNVLFCCDIKNEMQSSISPLQEKYRKFLGTDEEPVAQKMKILQPYFIIKDKSNETPDNNCVPWQIAFRDLNINDWLTLLNMSHLEATDPQPRTIYNMYIEIKEGRINNLEGVYRHLEENLTEKTEQSTKASLMKKLDVIKNFKIIGEEYSNDIGQLISEGYTVSINMRGYEKFGLGYPQAYVAIALRQTVQAKKDGRIKGKTLAIVDEAPRFCPSNGNPSSKQEIMGIIDKERSEGFSVLLGSQELADVPQKVFEQCRYALLPYSINWSTFRDILNHLGFLSSNHWEHDTYRRLLSSARLYNDGSRDKILIDKSQKRVFKILTACPLSAHSEEA